MPDAAAGARRRWARTLVAGAVVAAGVLFAPPPVSAAAAGDPRSTPSVAGDDTPQLADILGCGLGVVGGAIAKGSIIVIRKAIEFLGKVGEVGDLWEAMRLVYGRNPYTLPADERNDLIVILTGLDSCAKVSPPLHEAILGILDVLGGPPTGTATAAPTGLTVVASGPHAMLISWDDRSTGETGFEVNNGEVSRLVGPDVTSYTWDGLPGGNYMCVHVRSLNGSDSSPWEPADAPYYRCTTTPPEPRPGQQS